MRRNRFDSRGSRSEGRSSDHNSINSINRVQMKSLLEFLVSRLVDRKDSVLIDEREKHGKLYYDVTVAKSDMGKLLGRSGKTIGCIRTVVRAVASKAGGEVVVDVLEGDE